MRLPKTQIARFCSQNCDIHENLGGQGLGTEKINLNIFYLKKCVGPTCKKLDFAAKIAKFMEIWEVRSQGRKKTIWISSIWKNAPAQPPKSKILQTKLWNSWKSGRSGAGDEKKQFEYLLFEKMRLPNLQKARFCSQNCEIHGNLGGQEPGTEKNNWNIFYLKKCACPTSKKLDFAAKIAKFMEIWEVRSQGRKKTIWI